MLLQAGFDIPRSMRDVEEIVKPASSTRFLADPAYPDSAFHMA
jgi:hypothetical protein